MIKMACFKIVLLFVVLLVGCNFSKENKDTRKRTENIVPNQITVLTFKKSYHQFGKIKQGEIVGCYFKLKNEGDYPLIIYKVKPGCGCTTVNYPQKPIMPNQTGEIEVRFDTRGFLGHQYKVVSVHANIKNEVKELVVSANVIN